MLFLRSRIAASTALSDRRVPSYVLDLNLSIAPIAPIAPISSIALT
jgi:hypothetical protein